MGRGAADATYCIFGGRTCRVRAVGWARLNRSVGGGRGAGRGATLKSSRRAERELRGWCDGRRVGLEMGGMWEEVGSGCMAVLGMAGGGREECAFDGTNLKSKSEDLDTSFHAVCGADWEWQYAGYYQFFCIHRHRRVASPRNDPHEPKTIVHLLHPHLTLSPRLSSLTASPKCQHGPITTSRCQDPVQLHHRARRGVHHERKSPTPAP